MWKCEDRTQRGEAPSQLSSTTVVAKRAAPSVGAVPLPNSSTRRRELWLLEVRAVLSWLISQRKEDIPQADRLYCLKPDGDPGRVCRDTVHQMCQIDYQSHLLHEDTDILSSGICATPQ